MKRLISFFTAAVILVMLCTVAAVFAESNGTILANGDFETELIASANWKYPNTGGWYADVNSNESGQIAQRDSENKHGGLYSAKVYKGAIGQRVNLSAGKYQLKAFVMSDGAEGKIGVYDGAQEWPINPNYCIASSSLTNTNGEWQEITMDIECTSAKAYVVALTANNDTTVYVDDVTVTETEYSGNGIVNGNFANDLTGWTVSGNATADSGELLITKGTDETKVYQAVTNLTNGTYNLSVSAYADEIQTDGVIYIYAKTDGHTIAKTPVMQNTTLQTTLVANITVENGECEIGIYSDGSAEVTADNFSLSETESTGLPLYKGGEISKLSFVESKGQKFYRRDGSEADALQIMAENGFNLARIRILDNPGKGRGDGTYYLPEGYQNEEDCLTLAKRAKDKGMHILFSFAYSDYWVDGEKQIIPYSWQEEITERGLSGENKYKYLENKTYEYTKDIMQKLVAQGTRPEFVSIGNEIQVGIFFGNQKDKNCMWDSALYNNSANLARFLNAGARAVREVSPETKIILHSDNGGLLSKRPTFTNALKSVDFDVIGVSYYPFYNSSVSIDTVVNEFNSLIQNYNKDVIIMETGYNWSELGSDGWEGQLKDSGYYQNTYGETQKGQKAFLTELYSKLMQVSGGRCIGDCYWDPVMIGQYSDGVGWAISEEGDYVQGNVITNSTVFDFDGKATAGQLAMKHTSNSSDHISITGSISGSGERIKNTAITFTVNGKKYKTSTDKFGEYIVSVPYPKNATLSISAGGCAEKHELTAPNDDVLLSGINFETYTVKKQQLQPLDNKYKIEKITDGEGVKLRAEHSQSPISSAKAFAAIYASDGNLKEIRVIPCTVNESGIVTDSIDEPQLNEGENYKLMLWDNKHSPLITPIRKDDKFFN